MLPEISGQISDDLRSTINAAFEGDAPKIETPEPKVEPQDNAPSETIEASPEEHKSERQRDEAGRFVTKSEGAEEKKELKAAVEPEKVPDAKAEKPKHDLPSEDIKAKASKTQDSSPADAPPAGWTAEAKNEWSNLSPALKAAVHKREAEIANGGRQWSEEKRRYESLLSPVEQASRRYGLSAEQGLQSLMAAQNALETDAPSALRKLAAQYNVNLATLAGQSAPEGSHDNVPDIQSLVRQAVQPLIAPIYERYRSDDQRQQETTSRLVEEFASQPEHGHFESVEQELMAMIPHIKSANPSWAPQQILQDAYERAVYANPHTRAAILAEQNAKAEEKRRTEASERAVKARAAASSVTAGAPSTAADGSKGTIREDLLAAMAG